MGNILTFYADASSATGYGHLYRSLLVARTYNRRHGGPIRAVLQGGHDARLIEEAGIAVTFSDDGVVERVCTTADPQDGPVLLDTYSVTAEHLRALAGKGYRVAVFDDGRRLSHYEADVVIDSAPGAEALPYAGAQKTQFLLGAMYFPLREEFQNAIRKADDAGDDVGEPAVVVTFGASDPDDITRKAFEALRSLNGIRLIVVLGPGYKGRVSQDDVCENVKILRNVKDMAAVFGEAGVVLCGGGGTALEAAALGKAVAVIVLSPDQRPIAQSLGRVGAAQVVGDFDAVKLIAIANAVKDLLDDPKRRDTMAVAGRRLIDGKGAQRIADALWGL